jgi:hypothetical protein
MVGNIPQSSPPSPSSTHSDAMLASLLDHRSLREFQSLNFSEGIILQTTKDIIGLFEVCGSYRGFGESFFGP